MGQGRCVPTSATDPTQGLCEGGTFKASSSQATYISGWNFLDVTNFFAMRDNFRQDTLDHAQLARVLTSGQLDTLLAAQGAGTLDSTRIDYLGQSLGGFLGALYTSVSPNVRHAVLNVPGGDLTRLLLTSPAFVRERQSFLATLSAQGISQGTPAFDQFVGLCTMVLDPADPVNYAYHVENGAAVPAGREALIQYIDMDQVAPNPMTEALIAAANRASDNKKKVATVKFVFDSAQLPYEQRHGFLLNPNIAPEIRTQVQTQAIEFLNTGALP
jgi:pimeloyl-ACP methyl ester carboxylesterase